MGVENKEGSTINNDTSSSHKCEGRSKQFRVNSLAMILSRHSLRKHRCRWLKSQQRCFQNINNDAYQRDESIVVVKTDIQYAQYNKAQYAIICCIDAAEETHISFLSTCRLVQWP